MKYQYYTEATKDDFLRAFSNDSLLTGSELAQLWLHYQQPGHVATPTALGRLMGERSHHGGLRGPALNGLLPEGVTNGAIAGGPPPGLPDRHGGVPWS